MHNQQLLDGIVVFVEVIKAGSFTAAAQHLSLSTSYISKEVSKLEERLGIRLLSRTTRRLSLTPEGELYYQQCQQLVQDAIAAQTLLSGRQQEPQGTLKISCPVSFGLSRIQPILPEFFARYPKINFELELNDRKVDVVAEGYDLVIRASAELEDSSLISRKFMTVDNVTLAAPSYLKAKGTPKHPQELVEHDTICYSNLKSPTQWQYTLANNEKINVNVSSKMVTNSAALELSLCIAGQGILRLPRFNFHEELATGELVELFADLPKPTVGVYLVYPSRRHLASKVRCFIDFIIEKLGD